MSHPISRRTALKQLGTGTALATMTLATLPAADMSSPASASKGRIKQSVCQWCYGKMPLDDLCAAAAGMGLKSVELLQPKDFPTLKKYGLACAMVTAPNTKVGEVTVGGIPKAWNRVEYHDALAGIYEDYLKATAEAGFPNLICFSGNRDA
ncbi:MAG: hypothetical protein WDM96_11970 [Lacunisphaera sp.]